LTAKSGVALPRRSIGTTLSYCSNESIHSKVVLILQPFSKWTEPERCYRGLPYTHYHSIVTTKSSEKKVMAFAEKWLLPKNFGHW